MSWDDFKKQMEEAHKRAQAEFANTERIVTQDEVKLWEIEAKIVWGVQSEVEQFYWPDVVPVFNSDMKPIGAASILPQNTDMGVSHLVARATVDYSIPERLDCDNGTPVFLGIRDNYGEVYHSGGKTTYQIRGLVLGGSEDTASLLDRGIVSETARPKEN